MVTNRAVKLMPDNKNYQQGYTNGHNSGKEAGARTMAKLLIANAGVTPEQAIEALRAQFPTMETEANNVYLFLVSEFEKVAKGEMNPLPKSVWEDR